jgi:apolipoprotein N-acyltransferase
MPTAAAHPGQMARWQAGAALIAGAATVPGFAPIGAFVFPLITLAVLFWLWLDATPRRAFFLGWLFGLGLFLTGTSWVYVSLHTFGAMPMPLAALATLLFCAFLGLFPAVAGWCTARWRGNASVTLLLLCPATWMFSEWVRDWIFTGFPWLALGYSQVDASPLAGYVPLAGVFGITLLLALCSGLLVLLARRDGAGWQYALPLAAVVGAGFALKFIDWTQPTGINTRVSLLQGNVPQDMKWRPEALAATLKTYRDMVTASKAQLIVMPETALPMFLHQAPPEYLEELAAHARGNKGDVLLGVPERRPTGEYYNSVISLGSAKPQVYRKYHLVPFGEFIPLRPILGPIVGALAIPLQDFSRGAETQPPLDIAGQRVAVNVCYEDVFGEEIIRPLPQATVLVNVSNVAWFGDSLAPAQHLQISQMRALETGRYMLRATNTGMTAVIDQRGKVLKAAPPFQQAAVEHDVPGYQGTTPFVRWGNGLALALAGLMLLAGILLRKRKP